MDRLLIVFILGLVVAGSSSRIENVDVVRTDNSEILVCDYNDINETHDLKFSEIMDSIQLVKFEERPEAFFKCQWMHFSDNYIAVRQHDNHPVLLFDKSGRFITEVGAYGGGPEEYDTSIKDCILDEKNGVIYLLPFAGPKILKYDFSGQYIGEIKFPCWINKGKISLQSDSTLSVFHICFKDEEGKKFNGASVNLANDSISYFYIENLAVNMNTQAGREGFENEVWSYRSAENFSLSTTYNDTLYHFCPQENMVKASFTFKINKDEHKNDLSYFVLNEIPGYYIVHMVGDAKDVVIDKAKHVAYDVNYINDYMGNIPSTLKIQDGYFWSNLEPHQVVELLEGAIKSESLTVAQQERFEKILSELDEDGNNVLLIGKLKH